MWGASRYQMDTVKISSLLLLIGGLVHTFPPLGKNLTAIFGGDPLLQIGIGVLSLIVGFVTLKKALA